MKGYFTLFEKLLWGASAGVILLAWGIFDRSEGLRLVTSLIGVTSLILAAKGNPVSQGLIIVFSVLYAYISYSCAYYGEMITYALMTLPMAVISLVAWLRNPFKGKRAQVKVGDMRPRDWGIMGVLTLGVTAVFGVVLWRLGTAVLPVSILSVTTSFSAVYLTYKRSPYYALAYACNDLVLIVLWAAASAGDAKYFSVLACFGAFLANDIYGYLSWRRIKLRQELELRGQDQNSIK